MQQAALFRRGTTGEARGTALLLGDHAEKNISGVILA